MGNNFSSDANIFNEYFIYTLYTTTSLLSLTAIFMQWKTQGFKNKSLLLLLICILFFSVDCWVYNYLEYNGSLPSAALLNGSEAICHWIITYTYIKVAGPAGILRRPGENRASKQVQPEFKSDKRRRCFLDRRVKRAHSNWLSV